MLGRTFVVILFFWAALTVITPILIRLSASANVLDHDGLVTNGGVGVALLSRRALGSIGQPETKRPASSPSPSPSSSPSSSSVLSSSLEVHRQGAFEVGGDTQELYSYIKSKTQ